MKVLRLEWNSKELLDDESGESIEPVGELPLVGLGESEWERLMRGSRKKPWVDSSNVNPDINPTNPNPKPYFLLQKECAVRNRK